MQSTWTSNTQQMHDIRNYRFGLVNQQQIILAVLAILISILVFRSLG